MFQMKTKNLEERDRLGKGEQHSKDLGGWSHFVLEGTSFFLFFPLCFFPRVATKGNILNSWQAAKHEF